ncbi:MAG: hypothetical protein ACKVQC_01395 [Elusimicrobiota bacterium]
MAPDLFLKQFYEKVLSQVGSKDSISTTLDAETQDELGIILKFSESSKAVLTVFITSVVYKILYPDQDIRMHQISIPSGYSGRTFDKNYITPFLQSVKFPSMAESGWLTRSLEQKVPYDFNYPGAIQPPILKKAFLSLLDKIEQKAPCTAYLEYLFQGLIIKRNNQIITLSRPINLPISAIISLLEKHFNSKYTADGASRLPVLALYAVYQCLIDEVKRFENKILLPIESHTSADLRSGRIGDIEIINDDGSPFEAVEVKHGIQISLQLIKLAYEKLSKTQVSRFYLLSTTDIKESEKEAIENEISRIRSLHGCHVIANGLTKTLNYYLRLLADTSKFIAAYVTLLENDHALKFEHKTRWNELVSP